MIKYIIQIQEKDGAGMSIGLETETKDPISNNEMIVASLFRLAISEACEALDRTIPAIETIKGGAGAKEAILAAKKRHGFE